GAADHPCRTVAGDTAFAGGSATCDRGPDVMKPATFPVARAVWWLVAILLAGAVLYFWLRPTQLAAYQVEAAPLVQQVVATGRVISTSRTQVGSEITATVLERHVREGDRVQAGDLLVTLSAADL